MGRLDGNVAVITGATSGIGLAAAAVFVADGANIVSRGAGKTAAVMREIYKAAQPILPDDVAHAAVFLASDQSSFINGHDLVVDGAITGGRNWSQRHAGYVALRKAFDQRAGWATPSRAKRMSVV